MRRFVCGLGEESFFRALRPAPAKLSLVITVDAVLPDEQPRATCDQNRRDHRGVTNAIGKATCRDRPNDKR